MAETTIDIKSVARPLAGTGGDFTALLEMIGDARFVLLGEASHGTHEFYQARAQITRHLIEEKGFQAVAVEADWPDAYRVNCHVRGADDDGVSSAADAVASLEGFQKFPLWMWRNTEVLSFINWLRSHNATHENQCGFYGLDLYSLHGSIEAVLRYLDETDAEAAQRARSRYACFDHLSQDSQAYGYATAYGDKEPCEDAVIEQLMELQRHGADYANRDGALAEDKYFYAEQNARLVKNAENYYRSMFRGRVSSWNLRDSHMAETLDALVAHLERHGETAKVVVWAHNSHLGDARATDMGQQGEHNVGQLVRQKYGRDAVLIGFSTYSGEVTAASDWGKPAERKRVRPALEGSIEDLMHASGIENFWLNLRDEAPPALQTPRLERAIGVIYRPETERWSHYFEATLPRQFDALIHFDNTHALEPLDRTVQWERGEGEAPETFPFGV
jgi:erythromycin esterase-like protein